MSKQDSSKRAVAGAKFRLLIVDDHPVVLDGYTLMLNAQPDLEVCATALNAADAFGMVEREQPDLILTDLNMPGRSGLELIKDLVVLHPGVKVLVCSMHDEMLYAERALRAGAKGYLTKDSSGPVMIAAIRRVLDGGIYVSERLAARVLDAFAQARPRGSSSPLDKLSAFWRRPDGEGNRRATQPQPKDSFGASRSHQGEDGIHHQCGDDPASRPLGGDATPRWQVAAGSQKKQRPRDTSGAAGGG